MKVFAITWISFLLVACSFLSGCAQHYIYPSSPLQYKLPTPQSTQLAKYYQDYLAEHELALSDSAIYPLNDGVDAFVARLASIESATTSIDLQYYIYRPDETGKILSYFLLQAANRGVRVRLLLDDMTTSAIDSGLQTLQQHPNIYIRVFNPVNNRQRRALSFAADFKRTNHRMHNKSLTVDNILSIVGGRNIGDEYFSANEAVEFGDFDVYLMGPAVDSVSDQFDLYWNASQVKPYESLTDTDVEMSMSLTEMTNLPDLKQAFVNHPYIKRLYKNTFLQDILADSIHWYHGEVSVITDPPNKLNQLSLPTKKEWLVTDLADLFSRAKDKVLIVSPYFVPTSTGVDAIIGMVNQGIEVTVITNSLAATDVLAVHSGYQQYRQQLVDAGVILYELKAHLSDKYKSSNLLKGSSRASLHAKTFIIDEDVLFVGSFNFDPRSAKLNTEMGVIIEQTELAKQLLDNVSNHLTSKVYQVKLADDELVWLDLATGELLQNEPDSSLWQRFLVKLLSLLPIESQL